MLKKSEPTDFVQLSFLWADFEATLRIATPLRAYARKALCWVLARDPVIDLAIGRREASITISSAKRCEKGVPTFPQRSPPWLLSSRPGESHPQALLEPCVNLSTHTAPDVRPLPCHRPADGLQRFRADRRQKTVRVDMTLPVWEASKRVKANVISA